MGNARGASLAAVLPQAALKAMASRLPEKAEDMLALPYVTRANYHKYGDQLLQITSAYAIEKMGKIFSFSLLLYKYKFSTKVYCDKISKFEQSIFYLMLQF